LNLSYGVGDVVANVGANRKLLKRTYSLGPILSAAQVHGDAIFIAKHPLQSDLEVAGFDALMTDQPDLALLIQQADCQAITLFDPNHPAIAAIHCGWQGSVLNIAAKTVRAMIETYSSSAVEIQARVSPSLGPCCAEFVHHAIELPDAFLPFQVEKNHFDFWQISKMQLLEAGLYENNIHIAGICTSCSRDYFSYRRACRNGDGVTGRCATVISL
jgi:hypothetical protein